MTKQTGINPGFSSTNALAFFPRAVVIVDGVGVIVEQEGRWCRRHRSSFIKRVVVDMVANVLPPFVVSVCLLFVFPLSFFLRWDDGSAVVAAMSQSPLAPADTVVAPWVSELMPPRAPNCRGGGRETTGQEKKIKKQRQNPCFLSLAVVASCLLLALGAVVSPPFFLFFSIYEQEAVCLFQFSFWEDVRPASAVLLGAWPLFFSPFLSPSLFSWPVRNAATDPRVRFLCPLSFSFSFFVFPFSCLKKKMSRHHFRLRTTIGRK
nr:hypothetical protein [Pandoravirus massiliensis]